jgi:acetyl esterase/lipase
MASIELQGLIAMIRSNPFVGATLEESRQALDAMCGRFPVPDGVSLHQGKVNGVSVEHVLPRGADPDRVIVYLHGGAYTMGSLASHRALAARIAEAAGFAAVAVDYRLAPEHPMPAAIEDAVAVYRGVLAEGKAPGRLAIVGDSAGGGLAVTSVLALKAAGVPLPGAVVCLSPWTDLEMTGESYKTRAAIDPMISEAGGRAMAALYLAGADPRSPSASPIHGDLAGLPPMLIQVGTAETLYDDAVRLHERAKAAGVDATLEPWEEMIHVWQMFPMLPEAHRAVQRIGEFLRTHAR